MAASSLQSIERCPLLPEVDFPLHWQNIGKTKVSAAAAAAEEEIDNDEEEG